MDFLKDFEKSLTDVEGITSSSEPPRYWFSTGNHVMNRIISGSFYKGIPQGRITGLAGPAGSGKSFVAGNIMKHAQDQGAFLLVLDSENALDNDFVSKIGVDVDESGYKYYGISKVAHISQIVSSFIKGYRKQYGNEADAPKVLMVVDSLDMLLTESEAETYGRGDLKGDQGQRAKQLKQTLRTLVQDIKDLNISIVVTTQVYAASAEQILAGEGKWVVNNAIRFALSQIILLTKLKLKDTGSTEVRGIRMKAEGFKTRFTKPFQTVTVEVPYDTGMDPHSGLLEAALALGVVEKRGSRWAIAGADNSWYERDMAEHAQDILVKCEAMNDAYLKARLGENEQEDETAETKEETHVRRKTKK